VFKNETKCHSRNIKIEPRAIKHKKSGTEGVPKPQKYPKIGIELPKNGCRLFI